MRVEEYAKQNGLSDRRVRQLANLGRLKAKKIDGKWEISDPSRSIPTRRKMAQTQREDLLAYFKDPVKFLDTVTGYRKQRTLQHVGSLEKAERPDNLILEWFDGYSPEGVGVAAVIRELQKNGPSEGLPNLKGYLSTHSSIASRDTVRHRVVAARLKNRLTVEEAAKKTGFSEQQIIKMEKTGIVEDGVLGLRRYLLKYGEQPLHISIKDIRGDQNG